MTPIVKNILIFIGALILGMAANMLLLLAGMAVFPVEGMNEMTPEAIQEAFDAGKFSTIHFVIPIIAHSLQTFIAGLICGRFTVKTNSMLWAMAAGVVSLIFGIMNLAQVAHPDWFGPVDLLVSYLPMAYIGGKLGMRMKKN